MNVYKYGLNKRSLLSQYKEIDLQSNAYSQIVLTDNYNKPLLFFE